jgi:hypothetical protein
LSDLTESESISVTGRLHVQLQSSLCLMTLQDVTAERGLFSVLDTEMQLLPVQSTKTFCRSVGLLRF